MITIYINRRSARGITINKKVSTSTILVLEEAEKHGIVWEKIPYTGLFRLNFRGKDCYFHSQIPSITTEFAHHCCTHKNITNHLLRQANLSISDGYLIKPDDSQIYCRELFRSLTPPLVVKPTSEAQGSNVHLHLNTESEFLAAINSIHAFHGQKKINILVEEMFSAPEYRILTTRHKILSVIKRIAPNVIGDNRHSIQELIILKNRNPLRHSLGTYHSIKINEKLLSHLSSQNLSLNSIPIKGQQIFLLPKSSHDITLGGDTIDVTDIIHPSVRSIARRIMRSIPGLALAGIDYMSHDITRPQTKQNYRIIEVNASPSLDWNQYPLIGPERPIAFEFLKLMFPKL